MKDIGIKLIELGASLRAVYDVRERYGRILFDSIIEGNEKEELILQMKELVSRRNSLLDDVFPLLCENLQETIKNITHENDWAHLISPNLEGLNSTLKNLLSRHLSNITNSSEYCLYKST